MNTDIGSITMETHGKTTWIEVTKDTMELQGRLYLVQVAYGAKVNTDK
jgi:hypothetical protein